MLGNLPPPRRSKKAATFRIPVPVIPDSDEEVGWLLHQACACCSHARHCLLICIELHGHCRTSPGRGSG